MGWADTCCKIKSKAKLTHNNLAMLQYGHPRDFALMEKDKSVSRRACYNSLVRLKENAAKLKMLPENLRVKLMEENGTSKVPSDLVNMLMEAGNDLNSLSASFKAKQEQENELRERQKLVPMTETQIIGIYGADEAKNVMKSKKLQGLTVPDRNNPGKESYLMFQDEKEVSLVNRNSALATVNFQTGKETGFGKRFVPTVQCWCSPVVFGHPLCFQLRPVCWPWHQHW